MELCVGNDIVKSNGNWNFGGDVPKKFVNHIRNSVPLYDQGHDLICDVSDFFCKKDSICYELGTSTGQLIKKLAEHNANKKSSKWIGIDSEPEMVKEAIANCKEVDNIEIFYADILDFEYEKSDLIISYYTIQFTHEKHRQDLINKIYDRLNPGGAFVFFEKVRAPNARLQDICNSLYTEFKLSNGFSSSEILGKTKSLKGVLNPFSTDANISLLINSGFKEITTVMKYICFEGFIAIK